MKKRISALLLSILIAATTCAVPVCAASTSRFSDISNSNTAVTIESLRLMGVLDGYSDGTFRPDGKLTRAQFCKMAAYIMDAESELGRFRTVTIFPDVKPSHWAASYINLAAKGKGIISGYPNGMFQPERTVTVGHAVTILLRLLGYKDEEIGGVWPDSYMAVGTAIGLTDGVGKDGNAALTRAQAARLFLNLLTAKKNDGGTLYTLSKETELYSVDGSTGEMKTSSGTFSLVHPVSSTSLVGAKGYVVLNESGKALTFLPITSGSGGTTSAAIVLYEDKSTAGFNELAGASTYSIYKNGISIGIGGLRKNDVATYYPETNSIRICDTRVPVYYESCEPTPSAPTKIKVLGGTEFRVLPSAMDSLAKFKPGKQMTLLLTADGHVAAAFDGNAARANAAAIVSNDGTINLLCGTTMIPLQSKADEKYFGQLVRVSASKKDTIHLTSLSGGVSGDLNLTERTLGTKKLTENVLVFDHGKQISLSQITSEIVKKDQITYARTNWAGDVDLIVLNGNMNDTAIYGRAIVRTTVMGEGEDAETNTTVEVVYGDKTTGELETGYSVPNGSYVAAKVKDGRFTSLTTLGCLKSVSDTAWLGTGTVLHGGRSYSVSPDVLCYNKDSQEWITLDAARAYSKTADLYVKDGTVHIIEVAYTN